MQCKISKSMRNDALVCRVSGKEAAIKVRDYLNGLNYQSKFKPNPFTLTLGKAAFTMDGRLSYNNVLSKLLAQYFEVKKNSDQLNTVNSTDFNVFVKYQIELINSQQKKGFMELYGINSEEKCKDFLMICELISKNLDNSLSLDELLKLNDLKKNIVVNGATSYFSSDEDKLLYVINTLTNYYSVDDVHKIIMKYIETGDINCFTRKDDIRNIIYDNFTPNDVKNIISNLGWKTLVQASRVTYDKYGEEQLFMAIKSIFYEDKLKYFTNDYSARSRLGLVIPKTLLKKVIVGKLEEKGMNISSISLANLILDEISIIEDKSNKKGKTI